MKDGGEHIILCNGAILPAKLKKANHVDQLEYNPQSSKINVNIPLPQFVNQVYYLPDRIKDLLEIAAYVFAADRKTKRGTFDSVEYHGWSRSFHFVVKVRDHHFWNQGTIKAQLSELLVFMTGDKSYRFTFIKGHFTGQASFFDQEQFKIVPEKATSIILFSGGLDSMAGVLHKLNTSNDDICLISHVSQPGTGKTQNAIFEALERDFPDRCKHYKFKCNLKGDNAAEETQRSRSFLYSSIAFALAGAYSQDRFYFYENGITSINFMKREDLINARASRTTHPKSLGLLSNFFSVVNTSPILIEQPFQFYTKTDILNIIKEYKKESYINSTVSCSKTRTKSQNATHCGGCSQCVDRRFAVYGSILEDFDGNAIYDLDFIHQPIGDRGMKSTIIDYVRLALDLSRMNYMTFCSDRLSELSEIEPFIEGSNEDERTDKLHKLCSKHGKQILEAISRMNNPFEEIVPGSFLDIVRDRDYLRSDSKNLANTISNKLARALPIAFSTTKPKSERELNDSINAILSNEKDEYSREFPYVAFAMAKAVPDHAINGMDLFIEAKYIRGNTSPSKASEGLAADMSKYPSDTHKLFIVYDPECKISDRENFKKEFENKGNCTLTIIN